MTHPFGNLGATGIGKGADAAADMGAMTTRRVYAFLAVQFAVAVLVGAAANLELGGWIFDVAYVPVCALSWLPALRWFHGRDRLPWVLLAVAQSFWLAGDILQDVMYSVWDYSPESGPMDVLWLGAYPAFFAALILMVRRRAPGQLRASILDGMALTTAATVATGEWLIAPALRDNHSIQEAVTAFYPITDVLLLAGILLLVLSPGARGIPTRMLIGSGLLILGADITYTLPESVLSAELAASIGYGVTLFANALMVAAMLHPGRGELTAPALRTNTLHPARVLFLGISVLTAPAVALTHYRLSAEWRIILLTATIVVSAFILARFTIAVREQERVQRKLAYLAEHDQLTGLVNRRGLAATLPHVLQDPYSSALLLYIDLDGFKAVNDQAGHDAGDAVLVETARRLSAVVRDSDVVVRLGGDEFAVLCPGVATTSRGEVLAERVLHDLTAPIVYEGVPYRVGASIGIAVTDGHNPDAGTENARPQRLLADADAAMYQAKNLGKGRWMIAGRPDPADGLRLVS